MPRLLLRAALAAAIALAASGCERPPATAVDAGPPLPVVEYVTRQEILTPLPLRVSLPARYGAERVLVFVRTWGSHTWSTIELARAGQTWSGEVSCRAVSTVTGDTKYFFLALDSEGQTVVGSGSPEWPVVATIVGELPEGPRSLRGDPRPIRCHDQADCPPDFPGCPAYTVQRPACVQDDDCPSGRRCAWDGYCAVPPQPPGVRFMSEEESLAAAVRDVKSRYRKTASAGSMAR